MLSGLPEMRLRLVWILAERVLAENFNDLFSSILNLGKDCSYPKIRCICIENIYALFRGVGHDTFPQ